MFDYIRSTIGFDLFLLHDIHERIAPIDAMRMAKDLEPYRLFFLEDPLAPDQIELVPPPARAVRHADCHGRAAHQPAGVAAIDCRAADRFCSRTRLGSIGGLSPARKLAALCESSACAPPGMAPATPRRSGHAANLHLDLACHNFGIQEVINFSEAIYEVFPGTPELREGHLWANDKPGLGIDINEEAAAKYPITLKPIEWTQSRWPDGTMWTP